VAKNPILRFFDFLAKMGIMVRDDPPKVIDVAARTWGDAMDGFALSIEQIPHGDEDAPPSLSVVLRNVGDAAQTLEIPGWLHFYHFDLTAPLSPFGRELLKPERSSERLTVTLQPGETVDTQVPIGSIFTMKQKGEYRTRVSCTLPGGGALLSNTIAISV
jgi:hypothetical protein